MSEQERPRRGMNPAGWPPSITPKAPQAEEQPPGDPPEAVMLAYHFCERMAKCVSPWEYIVTENDVAEARTAWEALEAHNAAAYRLRLPSSAADAERLVKCAIEQAVIWAHSQAVAHGDRPRDWDSWDASLVRAAFDSYAALAGRASTAAAPPEPSDEAASAFLDAHHEDAPFTSAGIRQYDYDERVMYVKKWLRAAYAVDFGAAPSQRQETPNGKA